jgi:hypothetical protein
VAHSSRQKAAFAAGVLRGTLISDIVTGLLQEQHDCNLQRSAPMLAGNRLHGFAYNADFRVAPP